MKVSTRTYLERKDGQLAAEFEADGFVEHGRLPGMVDLSECLDILQLHEKGILDSEGHRIPVTVLALDTRTSLAAVEYYMKTEVEGPFHAAWTALDDKFEFMVAATELDGMRALRDIYRAAKEGRAFAEFSVRFFSGLRLVAKEDASVGSRAR